MARAEITVTVAPVLVNVATFLAKVTGKKYVCVHCKREVELHETYEDAVLWLDVVAYSSDCGPEFNWQEHEGRLT